MCTATYHARYRTWEIVRGQGSAHHLSLSLLIYFLNGDKKDRDLIILKWEEEDAM